MGEFGQFSFYVVAFLEGEGYNGRKERCLLWIRRKQENF